MKFAVENLKNLKQLHDLITDEVRLGMIGRKDGIPHISSGRRTIIVQSFSTHKMSGRR